MSDKEVLNNEAVDQDLEQDQEHLDEFKASYGDPSEVPAPTGKEAPKRKGDKDVEDDPQDAPTAVKAPGTKAGIINAVMNKMNGMNKKDLQAAYGKMMGMKEDVEVDVDDADEPVHSVRALPKICAEDINVVDDVDAMFDGAEDLTEEFKQKAAVVFEAAVVAKVNEQLEQISTNFEAELSEEIDNVRNEMVENLDAYLDYVVEQWMEENRLAVDQGLKAEMVDDFMKGLKDLFEQHYVDIPDDKVDVVEEIAAKAEELEARLNEEIGKNVELHRAVEEYTKQKLAESVAEDLTETQKAKFMTLAEGIDFQSEEAYAAKLDVIKESYFGNTEESVSEYNFDDSEPLEEEAKPATGPMAHYVDAISRSIKK